MTPEGEQAIAWKLDEIIELLNRMGPLVADIVNELRTLRGELR